MTLDYDILVIGGGKIVEQGTHDELMKKNGLYAATPAAKPLRRRRAWVRARCS